MSMFKVVPLCEKQLLDVDTADILSGGLYRKCNVYKSGGGYDKFPAICERRLGLSANLQFVVQLQGCPFKCPYCYVTEQGVNGKAIEISATDLVAAFKRSGCSIFHLMGGAPALVIEQWAELIPNVPIFHSDMLLVESDYSIETLKSIALPNALYAVSIKGADAAEYYHNTGSKVDMQQIKSNLLKLQECHVNFYVTFTGMSEESVRKFKLFVGNDEVFEDSFSIELIAYNAIKEEKADV